MNDTVITGIDQLSPEWLDAVLRRGGALQRGSVRGLDIDTMNSTNARFARLRPTYSPDATGEIPATLLLKMCHNDAESFGPPEVAFYTHDYQGLADAPMPRCYDGRYAENPRRYHLLLQDLADTHQPNWDVAPTLQYGLALADALARLHAFRWGAVRLEAIGASPAGPAELGRYAEHVNQGFSNIYTAVRDELPPRWRSLLPAPFDTYPRRLIGRSADTNGYTLIHGDANPGNILSPRQGAGPVFLLDRQPFDWSLTCWLGPSDLAYSVGLWWDTTLRRQWEMTILQHYHQQLQRYGVVGYSWEQTLLDYRLTLVQGLYTAVGWGVGDTFENFRWVWWPQIQRTIAALDDHGMPDFI